MKGTIYNGSHFASKGTSRSEGESMFSIGNLVAYKYNHYCSPDGRSSSSGCCPTIDGYMLQEEIVLEEYDNTESNRYGSGNCDVKKIVELIDIFWHEYSAGVTYKTFLLQVLESNKNVFECSFIAGDIAEVRNHAGKFLHIYEIPEGYRKCKAESFPATVGNINLQKKHEDDFETEKVAKNYRGVELIFGITASGWYASRASWGKHSVQAQHEHDSTFREHYKIVIMPCVPTTQHLFYLPDGSPMSLSVYQNEHPYISIMTSTRCGNSQSWHYDEIEILEIEKGWIFVDGIDVYDITKKTIEQKKAQKVFDRKKKFEVLSQAVGEKYDEEVIKLVLRKKGSVLSILKVLSENSIQVELTEIKKILSLSGDAEVIASLIVIVSAKLDIFKVAKVTEKAHARVYLRNAFPGVNFPPGHFDNTIKALEIYAKNWKVAQAQNEAQEGRPTIGDAYFEELAKIKNKLA